MYTRPVSSTVVRIDDADATRPRPRTGGAAPNYGFVVDSVNVSVLA